MRSQKVFQKEDVPVIVVGCDDDFKNDALAQKKLYDQLVKEIHI